MKTTQENADVGNQKRYVAGFMFDTEFRGVCLIRKNKPKWQMGLLNGIGGSIEPGETEEQAMCREFKEEAGIETAAGDWKHFCFMSGTNNDGESFTVDFFWATIGSFQKLCSVTSEPVDIHSPSEVCSGNRNTVGNVPWLIALALDCANGAYPPSRVEVGYAPR